MFAKKRNTKMAEGSDDPEGEESSEWFLPPTQLYLLSPALNMPELPFCSRSFWNSVFCDLSCVCLAVCFSERLRQRKCPTWQRSSSGEKKSWLETTRAFPSSWPAAKGRCSGTPPANATSISSPDSAARSSATVIPL